MAYSMIISGETALRLHQYAAEQHLTHVGAIWRLLDGVGAPLPEGSTGGEPDPRPNVTAALRAMAPRDAIGVDAGLGTVRTAVGRLTSAGEGAWYVRDMGPGLPVGVCRVR